MKFPITSVGKNMAKHDDAPCCKQINVMLTFMYSYIKKFTSSSARIQSHSGSIHSPQRIRNIIINE